MRRKEVRSGGSEKEERGVKDRGDARGKDGMSGEERGEKEGSKIGGRKR